MKKNICFIILLIVMLSISNCCLAYEPTGEVIEACLNNQILSEVKTNKFLLYRNQSTNFRFYFDYDYNNYDIPSGAGLFMIMKDENNEPVEYFDFRLDTWTWHDDAYRKFAEQVFKASDKYKSGKVYVLEIYDRNQVEEVGIANSVLRSKYKIRFAILDHEKHIYDARTRRCKCGTDMSAKVKAGTDRDSDLTTIKGSYAKVKNFDQLEVCLWTQDLFMGTEACIYDGFELSITSVENNYQRSIPVKFNSYERVFPSQQTNKYGVYVEPNYYYYDMYYYYVDYPVDAPNGRTQVDIKVGGTVFMSFYADVENTKRNTGFQFKDLSKEHWAYESIMVLVQNGVIFGYEDGTFKPEQEVTREEFMKMMYNVVNQSAYYSDYLEYKDVEKDRWSYNSIHELGCSLVESPDGNNYFYPTRILKRKEMAKIIVMIKELYGFDYSAEEKQAKKNSSGYICAKYKDLTNTDEYMPYIYTAINNGIMNGVSDSKFSPNTGVTRAQAATLIKRIYYPDTKYIAEVTDEKESDVNGKINNNQIEKFLNASKINSWYEVKIGDNIINLNKENSTTCNLYYEESNEINKTKVYLDINSLRKEKGLISIGKIYSYARIFGFDIELSADKKIATLKKEINEKNIL